MDETVLIDNAIQSVILKLVIHNCGMRLGLEAVTMRISDYDLLKKQITALAEISSNWMPVLSNASALIYDALDDVNWAGFYIVRDDALLLGPFQGKVACVAIDKGRGVCGTAFSKDEVQVVPDVHEFPGHIACDSASQSEIVIPIHNGEEVVAVLDIDSPVKNRFDKTDCAGLTEFVRCLEDIIEW